MRILHTSDWHLGKSLVGKPRLAEQRQMLGELFDVVRRERIDVLLVCGDIFDTAVPKAEAEELFFEQLVRLSSACTVVCFAGNHDDGDRLGAPSPVAVYSGIYLVGGMDNRALSRGDVTGGDGWLRICKGGERLNLALMPYPFSSGMISQTARGKSTAICGDEGENADSLWQSMEQSTQQSIEQTTQKSIEQSAQQSSEQIAEQSAEQIAEKNNTESNGENIDNAAGKTDNESRVKQLIDRCCACFGEGINIFASHLFITGSQVSEERELGSAPLLSKDILPMCDYVALGHIHKPQSLSRSRRIIYSGSPLKYSFDDKTDKYFYIYDSADGEVVRLPIESGKKLVVAEVDDFDGAIRALTDNPDAYVKLVYRGLPLALSQIKEIKSHDSFTDIKFETTAERVNRISRADSSPEELFRAFYLSQKGEMPDAQLTDLFLAVLGGEYEAD